MRLFHFSEDGQIDQFTPRSVRQPALRKPGQEWLNSPLVWAIDADHQRLYLFPRECPRIVVWAHSASSHDDRMAWMGDLPCGVQAVAFIERAWVDRHRSGSTFRYEFPVHSFECIDDAGMFVSRSVVHPLGCERIANLPLALNDSHTELRVVDSLLPLRGVWNSTLHASGIRLRNASGWA
ncbi:DUF6886 family protein [Variovorax boronicumulans]|uniref:DUF6886 family protein n=1 Tax=Variovorax boronicumulans TaxID=436515 RepID=UPI0012E55DCA|nr:DUF6886 family protein [Variovorax boronicumulans]GER15803.1 hypothetical protein VCH24_07970 [Variovorax boronicumulans]